MRKIVVASTLALIVLLTSGWGPRGHITSNRVAVDSLPADGPVFLREFKDWIAATGPLPDSWRGASEPYSKLFEDPNHGWFKEQFSFLKEIPRSRYDFVLRLYDEYLRIKGTDPDRARLMNVRWTGTLPYAAMENFDRMKAAMRGYRAAPDSSPERRYLAQDIAFYLGWLGHYTADGAQPLHDSIHHDGWLGPNPKNYTRDGRIHVRFETTFVDLIELRDSDLAPQVTAARVLSDPFAAFVAHLDDAYTHVEEVYRLDQRGAFADKNDQQARTLVTRQLSRSSSLLRDLAYTAWLDSANPAPPPTAASNPLSFDNPAYDPRLGTAPPPGPPVPNKN